MFGWLRYVFHSSPFLQKPTQHFANLHKTSIAPENKQKLTCGLLFCYDKLHSALQCNLKWRPNLLPACARHSSTHGQYALPDKYAALSFCGRNQFVHNEISAFKCSVMLLGLWGGICHRTPDTRGHTYIFFKTLSIVFFSPLNTMMQNISICLWSLIGRSELSVRFPVYFFFILIIS